VRSLSLFWLHLRLMSLFLRREPPLFRLSAREEGLLLQGGVGEDGCGGRPHAECRGESGSSSSSLPFPLTSRRAHPLPSQDDKIYVQHRIPEFAEQIWDYFERGGFLYVCGCVSLLFLPIPRAQTFSLLQVVYQHAQGCQEGHLARLRRQRRALGQRGRNRRGGGEEVG
jgi:hypothetical protein